MSALGLSHAHAVGQQVPYMSASGFTLTENSMDFLMVDVACVPNSQNTAMSEASDSPERKNSRSEQIYSGHYMISELDEEKEEESKIELVTEKQERRISKQEEILEVEPTCPEQTQKYVYGPRNSQAISIDSSLSKLLECMSLAYNGSLTSPKWKPFKGLRLTVRDKIRLNNIIWRCWHMQYLMGKLTSICQFAITSDTHNKPEAQVMEGTYSKRRATTVTAEYKKWRLFHVDQVARKKNEGSSLSAISRWSDAFACSNSMPSSSFEDDLVMDFSDTTLMSLLQPNMVDFPNPRDIARSGFGADFIQPGLTQLQPPLDDFMDSFEPLQDFFMSRNLTTLPPVPEEPAHDEVPKYEQKLVETPDYSARQDYSQTNYQNQGPLVNHYAPLQLPGSSSQLNHNEPQSSQVQLSQGYAQVDIEGNSAIKRVPYVSTTTPSMMQFDHQSQMKPRPQDFLNSSSNYANMSYTMNTNQYANNNVQYQNTEQQVKQAHFAVPKLPVKNQRVRARNLTGVSNMKTSNNVQVQAMNTSLGDLQATSNNNNMGNSSVERTNEQQPMYAARRVGRVENPQDMALLSSSSLQLNQSMSHADSQTAHICSNMSPLAMNNCSTTTALTPYTTDSSSSLIAQLLSATSPQGSVRNPVIESLRQQSSPTMPLASHDLFQQASFVGKVPSSRRFKTVDDISVYTQKMPPMRKISSPGRIGSPSSPHQMKSESPKPPSPLSLSASAKGKQKSDHEKISYREHRRVCHINAEQKRRCNIKNGFDTLRAILPSISQSTSTKISKAAMLSKGGEHIRTLKQERQQQQDECDVLKQQIERLNKEIGDFQSQLPATGAPMACHRTGRTKELFGNYVADRTQQNWKFWVFSIMMESLLESYESSVATNNVEEMYKSTLRWLDQSCNLVSLRRNVLNSLRHISTSTNILTNPSSLPEEAMAAVMKKASKTS
ncbi:MLX-interacting protein [Halotydeus destructor]|nr:MLX-interacting protein [Halotydeus destructor]